MLDEGVVTPRGTLGGPPPGLVTSMARDVTKSYKFIGFGTMDVTKPYKFIGFGAMDVAIPFV
jgi:hypothetical protein